METNKVGLKIDGKEVLADGGTTILEAAQQNSIHIPTLCHHPALSNWGGCRMCMVEVDGAPRLVASCVTPVRDGMEVTTNNERIIEHRRTVLEFLFAERNHNCMFCPQSGDCELQKLAYELQMDHLTVSVSYDQFPTDITSEYMAIDHNRCILCGRCVRACAEIAGNYVLNFQNRGPKNLIGLDLNETREGSTCLACGVCMQVCPTGAIANRYRTHYAVKGHIHDWQSIESLCPQCGLLCPTVSFVNDNNLIKIEGKLFGENNRPDRGQLCYKGRFDVLKSRGRRLLHPMVRNKDGTWKKENWENALDLIAERLNAIKEHEGGKALFGLASSMVSNEVLVSFRDIMIKGLEAGSLDTLDGSHFRAISKMWNDPGRSFKEASWKLIPEADFILIAGADPYQKQPALSSLIRRSILENGTHVAVIGEMEHMAPFTSYYLPVKKGNEPLLIKAFLKDVITSVKELRRNNHWKRISDELEKEKVNVPVLLENACLTEYDRKIFYEATRSFINADTPLMIAGEGLTGHENPSGLKDFLNLTLLKGLLHEDILRLIILKPNGNSAGAWKLGLSSNKGLNDKEQWRGGIILSDGEEISDPQVLDKLNNLNFLAVISPYLKESLANKADVLLPIPLWMEEDGTYTSLDGCQIGFKRKVLEAPEGVKDSWQTLRFLAELTSFHADYETWNDLSKTAEREIRNGG